MIDNQARLFGLDLSALASEWRDAWLGLLHGPWRRWLTPATPVRLLLPDGSDAIWSSPGKPLRLKPELQALSRARFLGVVLPEELLLRRSWALPPLPDAACQSAVDLELRGVSPFAAADTLAVYAFDPAAGDKRQVHAVLLSRARVAEYLSAQASRLGKEADPEVWVSLGEKNVQWRDVQGFGGGRRDRRQALWASLAAFMALGCVALLTAMAVTPTLQLRERALQAQQNFAELQVKAAPAMGHRESLVRHAEMLDGVTRIMGEKISALAALDLITRWLPDGTFLTSFQIEGLKIRLAGQTDNAANLMRQLGGQPGVLEIKSPTASVRVPGLNRETFTVEFSLDLKTAQGGQP